MRLETLLGDGQVLIPGRDDVSRYETDVLGRRSPACWVARPRDVDEVRAVARWAYAEGAEFVVQGANTGPVLAGVPRPGRRQGVLSMEFCRSKIDVDVANRTVTVSAGVDLATLNEVLARDGLTFPIDLGANPSVGGMVGANAGGARLIRHGDVRRHVLGLEVVLPDEHATVLSLLSHLRKDNHGPDLKQLFIASSGTLGIVTTAVLSVDPVPRRVAVALVAVNGGADVLRLLSFLEATVAERLSAFEMLSRPAVEAIARRRPDCMPLSLAQSGQRSEFLLLVELNDSDATAGEHQGLDEQLAALLDRASAEGWVDDAWFGPPAKLWALRHAAIDALRQEGPIVAFDLSVPRSRLFDVRQRLITLVNQTAPRARYADFGHVGDGGVHSIVIWPDGMHAGWRQAEQRQLRDAVYDLVAAAGGTFSGEHGIGPENESAFRRHTPLEERRLHAALKSLFDPQGILGATDLS
jgi:FAD/FMN-containing dehydrogenase